MHVVEIVTRSQTLHTAVPALLVCQSGSHGAGLRRFCLINGHMLLSDAEVLIESLVT